MDQIKICGIFCILVLIFDDIMSGHTGDNFRLKDKNVCNNTVKDLLQSDKNLYMERAKEQYLQYIGNSREDESHFLDESSKNMRLRNDGFLRKSYLKKYNELRMNIDYKPRACKSSWKNNKGFMIHSTCPWYIEMTYDKYRYPTIVNKARCACPRCYTLKNANEIVPNRLRQIKTKELKRSKCVPINIWRRVVRLRLYENGEPYCKDGEPVYINTWEKVPVGCTCVLNVRDLANPMPAKMRH